MPLDITHFEFGAKLGSGAFSNVYFGRRKLKSNINLGIKVINIEKVKRAKRIHDVDMELYLSQLLKNHTNPFIIRCLYFFQEQSHLFLCLESALGGNLQSLVKRSKIDSQALDCVIAKFFTAELISALQFLHVNNVVHRDVNPRNILIVSNGHIKLSDFGSACLLTCNPDQHPDFIASIWKECANNFVGSFEYISPEVLDDIPATPASDLWATGCVLYYMLVGISPFFTTPVDGDAEDANNPQVIEYSTYQAIRKYCGTSKIILVEGESVEEAEATAAEARKNIIPVPLVYPTAVTNHPEAHDLIHQLLQPKPELRLGATPTLTTTTVDSEVETSSNSDNISRDPSALRTHPFFESIDWNTLHDTISPYQPDPVTFPSTENLVDGNTFLV